MHFKLHQLLIIVLLLASQPALSAIYYVSPTGGQGTGSSSDPWSLDYANKNLRAGDTAKLKPGTYRDQVIKPENSGTASSPIVYVAESKDNRPKFRGSSRGSIDFLIVLTNRSYITIDSITADGEGIYTDARINRWAVLDNTTYCIIKNSHFYRSRGYVAIDFLSNGNSHHNKIINNVVDTNGTWDVFPWDGFHDDSGSSFWIKDGNHHNLIEGNTFRRSGHDTGGLEGEYNIIRNNTFDNDWGIYDGPSFKFKQGDIRTGARVGNRVLSMKAGKNNLVEGNVFRNAPTSVDEYNVPMMKFAGMNQIVRNNYFLNGNHAALHIGIGRANPKGESNVAYHNTFYNLGGPAWRIQIHSNEFGAPKNNSLKNNIMYKTHHTPLEDRYDAEVMFKGPLKYFGNAFLNNEFSHNCVSSDSNASEQMVYTEATYKKSLTYMEGAYAKHFHSNIQVNPKFVSVAPQTANDLKLSQNSPCRNQGGSLTTTASSGSGNRITLTDSTYFTDGFGLIEVDLIRIGDDSNLKIVSINYSTNEVTINKYINWNKNEPVNLNFSGNKPDMGVLSNLGSQIAEAQILSPPTNLILQFRSQ